MKYSIESTVLVFLLAFFAVSASAEQAPTTQSQSPGSMQGMGSKGGMGMGGMNMSDEQLRARQDEMLKMHDLMTRINATQDPAERERLKAEHLQMMKAHHEKMMQHRQMMMQHGSMTPGGMKMHPPAGETPQ